MNKIIQNSLLLLCTVFALFACSDDVEYDGPGEWNAADNYTQVSFATASENIELDPEEATSHAVTLTRKSTGSELTVPITIVSNDDNVFTTTEARFAAGDSTTVFYVNFPSAEVGQPYSVRLLIEDPTVASYYSDNNIYDLTVTRVKWNDVGYYIDDNGNRVDGYANFTDGFVDGVFGVGVYTYPTRLQERNDRPGYFRMVNTYTLPYNPFVEEGDYDASTNHYIIIDATNPDQVYIPHYQNTGFIVNSSYGELQISSYAGYRLYQGRPADAAQYYGTYANGKITFPANSLLVALGSYNGGMDELYAWYATDFSLVIDPSKDLYEMNVLTDFDWGEPLYNGVFTSAQMGTTTNANLYKGTASVTTDSCDVRFHNEYGTPYSIEAPYADGYDLVFCVNDDGEITLPAELESQETGLTAVGEKVYAHINAAASSFSENAVTLNITFTNEDGSLTYGTANETLQNRTWTEVGTADYTYSVLFVDDDGNSVVDAGLTLSKLDQDEVTYKLSHWGYDVDFEFTWDQSTNLCTVAPQPTGATYGSYGMIYVTDVPSFASSRSYTDYPCYYDTDTKTFHFTLFYGFVSGDYAGQGFGIGEETMTINLNAASAKAKAAKKASTKRISHKKPSVKLPYKYKLIGTHNDWKSSVNSKKAQIF